MTGSGNFSILFIVLNTYFLYTLDEPRLNTNNKE